MNVFIGTLAVLVLIVEVYSNCGCLKCNKDLQVISPPGSPIKLIYKHNPCSCPYAIPYSVQVPTEAVNYDDPRRGRCFGYQVQLEKPKTAKTASLKLPCPALQNYGFQVQIPVETRAKHSYLVGLTAKTDRILIAQPPIQQPAGCAPVLESYDFRDFRRSDDFIYKRYKKDAASYVDTFPIHSHSPEKNFEKVPRVQSKQNNKQREVLVRPKRIISGSDSFARENDISSSAFGNKDTSNQLGHLRPSDYETSNSKHEEKESNVRMFYAKFKSKNPKSSLQTTALGSLEIRRNKSNNMLSATKISLNDFGNAFRIQRKKFVLSHDSQNRNRPKRSINWKLLALKPENPSKLHRMRLNEELPSYVTQSSSKEPRRIKIPARHANEASYMLVPNTKPFQRKFRNSPYQTVYVNEEPFKFRPNPKPHQKKPRVTTNKKILGNRRSKLRKPSNFLPSLKKVTKTIKDWLTRELRQPLYPPQVQLPHYLSSSPPSQGWCNCQKRKNALPFNDRFKRALKIKNDDILPFFTLEDDAAKPLKRRSKQSRIKKEEPLKEVYNEEVPDPYLSAFNYDHILHRTPLLHLLNAPIRYLNHVHNFNSHVSPVIGTIPRVIHVSKRYLIELLRNFGRSAFRLGGHFLRGFADIKRGKMLSKIRRRRKRNVDDMVNSKDNQEDFTFRKFFEDHPDRIEKVNQQTSQNGKPFGTTEKSDAFSFLKRIPSVGTQEESSHVEDTISFLLHNRTDEFESRHEGIPKELARHITIEEGIQASKQERSVTNYNNHNEQEEFITEPENTETKADTSHSRQRSNISHLQTAKNEESQTEPPIKLTNDRSSIQVEVIPSAFTSMETQIERPVITFNPKIMEQTKHVDAWFGDTSSKPENSSQTITGGGINPIESIDRTKTIQDDPMSAKTKSELFPKRNITVKATDVVDVETLEKIESANPPKRQTKNIQRIERISKTKVPEQKTNETNLHSKTNSEMPEDEEKRSITNDNIAPALDETKQGRQRKSPASIFEIEEGNSDHDAFDQILASFLAKNRNRDFPQPERRKREISKLPQQRRPEEKPNALEEFLKFLLSHAGSTEILRRIRRKRSVEMPESEDEEILAEVLKHLIEPKGKNGKVFREMGIRRAKRNIDPIIKKKEFSNNLDINLQIIKKKMVQISNKIEQIQNYNSTNDLDLYKHFLNLDVVKNNLVQIPTTFWENYVQEIRHLSHSLMQSIVEKLNRSVLKRNLIHLLVRLQKFNCIVKNQDRGLLGKFHFSPAKTPKEIQSALERNQERELNRQLGILQELERIVKGKNKRELEEEAKIIWEIDNVEKLQRHSIEELNRKISQGTTMRRELKILFDLDKQLEDCEEKQDILINSRAAISARPPMD